MGAGIFHRHWGKGRPLIAIHGLFGSLENLGMVTRRLMDSHSVYAVDLPNHGRSAHTPNATLASMADAMVGWMDENGMETAHFLGHSLGGKVSMEIALRHPQRVDRLIVADIAPVSYDRRHDDLFAVFHDIDLKTIQNRTDACRAMETRVMDIPTRSFLLKNLVKTDDGWQWRMNLEVLRRDYGHIIAGNTTEYPAFEREVLFIKGEKSDYIRPEHWQQIINLFPKASIEVIQNTRHWLHIEKPDIFASMVRRFIAGDNP